MENNTILILQKRLSELEKKVEIYYQMLKESIQTSTAQMANLAQSVSVQSLGLEAVADSQAGGLSKTTLAKTTEEVKEVTSAAANLTNEQMQLNNTTMERVEEAQAETNMQSVNEVQIEVGIQTMGEEKIKDVQLGEKENLESEVKPKNEESQISGQSDLDSKATNEAPKEDYIKLTTVQSDGEQIEGQLTLFEEEQY